MQAQGILNNGANIVLNNGATIYINATTGHYKNQNSGLIKNNTAGGTINMFDNWANNAANVVCAGCATGGAVATNGMVKIYWQ